MALFGWPLHSLNLACIALAIYLASCWLLNFEYVGFLVK